MAVSETARNTLILLLVFALLGLIASSVNQDEARLLWAIHDPGPAPDSIGDALRFARDSLLRAYERGGPGALVFDAWAMLAGPSAEAARLLAWLAALLIVAVVLARRAWVLVFVAVPFLFYAAYAGLPLLLLALVTVGVGWALRPRGQSFLQVARPLLLAGLVIQIPLALLYPTTPDWYGAARYIMDQREPQEPLLFTFQPNEPLGYYDRRYGIREGITLDLGWRDHDAAEIRGYIERLAGAETIWLVLPVADRVTADVLAAISADYAPADETTTDGLLIARYERRAR